MAGAEAPVLYREMGNAGLMARSSTRSDVFIVCQESRFLHSRSLALPTSVGMTFGAKRCALRPALCGFVPASGADWLRGGYDRGRRNADGLLRAVDGSCQRRLGYVRNGFFLFRKQRSYQAQGLDFFLQPCQLHFFLPQNLVDILHRLGHLRIVRFTPSLSRTVAWFCGLSTLKDGRFLPDGPGVFRVS